MFGRLLHRIESSGPILFDEYMEICLYDSENGFFTAGALRPGTDGDFVTSPEVSPWFGRLIGRWVGASTPDDWPIVEIGRYDLRGGSNNFPSSFVRLLVWISTNECRQKGMMNVYNVILPS